ncbi:MAG: cytochrome c biogenesis protein CcdA [Candidatus Tritonobacter lacicola]|nr:cytochrome c biogenesis protein CcdA [Candidatus Tritonobacter lacicola]
MRSCNCNSRGLRLTVLCAIALSIGAAVAPAQSQSPFSVTSNLEKKAGGLVVEISFTIPPGHFLYADQLKVEAGGGAALVPLEVPAPVRKLDRLSGESKELYVKSFRAYYRVEKSDVPELEVTVSFQGCDDQVCFLPETNRWTFNMGSGLHIPHLNVECGDLTPYLRGFKEVRRGSGYMGAKDFLALLDRAGEGRGRPAGALEHFEKRGWLVTVLLILAGGLALNLTPCVLPMIPINLAIIGAGARAGSRGRGFALGGTYGLAMALVYGALGLAVVLTGSKFGALNASPWFNLVIAVVFFFLAMAMFGVFNIDFTRFGNRLGGRPQGKSGFLLAFTMGAVAALLAGACVAPVLISVLLLSGTLYSRGAVVALFLPFLLGAGMGLPWPFAGAGLSFLPGPGRWMTWVKYVFAVFILSMALYYAHISYGGFKGAPAVECCGDKKEGVFYVTADNSYEGLTEALNYASNRGKMVLIDFWATWCKNCHVMEKTTFRDAKVKERLESYVVVKYAAEKPNEPPAKEVLDYFNVVGLPTYVILKPRNMEARSKL